MFYIVSFKMRYSVAHCELHLSVSVHIDINCEIPLWNLPEPLLEWLDLRDTSYVKEIKIRRRPKAKSYLQLA